MFLPKTLLLVYAQRTSQCCWAASRNSFARGSTASWSSSGLNTSTSFPAMTTHTKSQSRRTWSRLCETMITVSPRVLFSCSTVSSMWRVEIGSRALVGSSRRRTCSPIHKRVRKRVYKLSAHVWSFRPWKMEVNLTLVGRLPLILIIVPCLSRQNIHAKVDILWSTYGQNVNLIHDSECKKSWGLYQHLKQNAHIG